MLTAVRSVQPSSPHHPHAPLTNHPAHNRSASQVIATSAVPQLKKLSLVPVLLAKLFRKEGVRPQFTFKEGQMPEQIGGCWLGCGGWWSVLHVWMGDGRHAGQSGHRITLADKCLLSQSEHSTEALRTGWVPPVLQTGRGRRRRSMPPRLRVRGEGRGDAGTVEKMRRRWRRCGEGGEGASGSEWGVAAQRPACMQLAWRDLHALQPTPPPTHLLLTLLPLLGSVVDAKHEGRH